MYNPQNLHECEVEKKRKPRGLIDSLMTGVGAIASISSVPQIIKIYETGSVEGISLMAYLISFGAVTAWFFYGLYIKNKPLIITSGLGILVLGTVVIQILSYQ